MEIRTLKEALETQDYSNVKVKVVDVEKYFKGQRKDGGSYTKQMLKIQDDSAHGHLVIWDRSEYPSSIIGNTYLVKSVSVGENQGERVLRSGKFFELIPVVKEKGEAPIEKIDLEKEIAKHPDDMEEWLTYRERLDEILSLFKTHGCTSSDTALAGAILGMRELMARRNGK